MWPTTCAPRSLRLFVVLLDEGRKGVDVLLEHLPQRFLGEIALVVEGIADAVQVDLRLLHDRPRDTRQDVLQGLGGADAAERTGRVADDAGRLAVEGAFAVGARSDVDRVLQYA